MGLPLRTEKRPASPVREDVAPPGRAYRVRDGDDWRSVAKAASVDPWDLIAFNFHTLDPGEVNWYLREYVGCVVATRDRNNWRFSSGLAGGRGVWKGGTLWLPSPGRQGHIHRITNIRANATAPSLREFGGGASEPERSVPHRPPSRSIRRLR